jgi:hypothetical protein
MIIFRPTLSLSKKMGMKLSSSNENSTNALGDWSAVDFSLGKSRYVLCVSHRTRQPVVVPAAPYSEVVMRLRATLMETLYALEIPSTQIKRELPEMADVAYAKTNDRSILGTLNDYRGALEFHHELGRIRNYKDYIWMSLWLSETPMRTLGWKYPREATAGALARGGGANLKLVSDLGEHNVIQGNFGSIGPNRL